MLRVKIPLIWILGGIGIAAGLVSGLRQGQQRWELERIVRATASQAALAQRATAEAVAAARTEERAAADARVSEMEAMKVDVESKFPLPGQIDERSLRLLMVLIRSYPNLVSIYAVIEQFGLGFPVIEWMAENLERLQLVNIVAGDQPRSSNIVLTKVGRDYCLTKALDLS